MNLTNLAGEKSEVRIQHASIASGNLSLVGEDNKHPVKKILGKKVLRPEESNTAQSEKKKIHSTEDSDKKDLVNLDKSNYLCINF